MYKVLSRIPTNQTFLIVREACRQFAALCLLSACGAWAHAGDKAPLTDADIAVVFESESSGVFYAWSPHMPLSVDGLKEILAAGEQLEVIVIPVLSPHANVDYARDRLRDRGLPEDLLQESQSSELVRRDLFLHAPALLVFDDGEFVSPVLPGLRRADDYADLVRRFLESAEE